MNSQAAHEISRLSQLSKKDIDTSFDLKKVLILQTTENNDIENFLRKDSYFCDNNYTNKYGQDNYLITPESIYGKRVFYRLNYLKMEKEDYDSFRIICEYIEKEYDNYNSFIIIQNLSTISYTASFLSFMLENLTKPVILTGSPDIRSNLLNSLIFAGHFVFPEVLVCFRDKIFRGNRSQVYDAEGLDCIVSPNFEILANFGIKISVNKKNMLKIDKNNSFKAFINMSRNVAILKLTPFLSSKFLENILNIKDLKGLVLETYGFGQISSKNLKFIKLLELANEKGT